ncbi:transglutaminase family protein [Derxia lacustris]|uniref:transglutaminase family protein n=1 Tax=Derxia lacustris TaxID=764842 RepID=UPI000A173758|nr:transglutaminase family protein [Derxia lacustris]
MRLSVLHETTYSYTAPFHYSIQQLRLTPRPCANRSVVEWQLTGPVPLSATPDPFDNPMHTLSITNHGSKIHVSARGLVETTPPHDGRVDEKPGRGDSPHHFVSATHFTQPDERLLDFAAALRDRPGPAALLDFAQLVRDAVQYETGSTHVGVTAAQALAQGRGVCQDHAHVFAAACRARGVPCRYVSGYFCPEGAPGEASHAWAEAWVEDPLLPGGGSWTGIDVTHAGFAGERHVRLAIGRDYESAAPIRGMRSGGGAERMRVLVHITPR